ncbi:hypothetical protein AMTR_s00178p00060300 [Amborella trichopoda]|uniref:Uncharacterized protein n=1 Tax=Amborella trichopoda TaxID=13333 RepID=W1PSP4_AMBTC|nr:hypothetical protein AMTR_s00178p00060300 [Amborella trichopoda]
MAALLSDMTVNLALHPEEPPMGSVYMNIPKIVVRPTVFGKVLLAPFPFDAKKVAYSKYSFSLLLWLLSVASVGQNQASAVALNLLLLTAAKMYPLFHLNVARKARASPRSAFDPKVVDPLAVMVINKDEGLSDLEEGEFVLDIAPARVEPDSR